MITENILATISGHLFANHHSCDKLSLQRNMTSNAIFTRPPIVTWFPNMQNPPPAISQISRLKPFFSRDSFFVDAKIITTKPWTAGRINENRSPKTILVPSHAANRYKDCRSSTRVKLHNRIVPLQRLFRKRLNIVLDAHPNFLMRCKCRLVHLHQSICIMSYDFNVVDDSMGLENSERQISAGMGS